MKRIIVLFTVLILGWGSSGVAHAANNPPLNVNVTNTPLSVTTQGTTTISNGVNNPVPVISTEERTPYSNIKADGSICGTSEQNQCVVPAGKQLVIEHVSGYIFKAAATSSFQTTAREMFVKNPPLGFLGSHLFLATKINGDQAITNVFVFGSPFKMRLSPNAGYYFEDVTAVFVTGYLIDAP